MLGWCDWELVKNYADERPPVLISQDAVDVKSDVNST
jgi:hypothetical protein